MTALIGQITIEQLHDIALNLSKKRLYVIGTFESFHKNSVHCLCSLVNFYLSSPVYIIFRRTNGILVTCKHIQGTAIHSSAFPKGNTGSSRNSGIMFGESPTPRMDQRSCQLIPTLRNPLVSRDQSTLGMIPC